MEANQKPMWRAVDMSDLETDGARAFRGIAVSVIVGLAVWLVILL